MFSAERNQRAAGAGANNGLTAPPVWTMLGRSVSNGCQTNVAGRAESASDYRLDIAADLPHSQGLGGIRPDGPDGPHRAHNPKVAGSNPAPATPTRP